MQKITPCLWFDSHTEEAFTKYTSVFKNAKIESIQRYPDGFDEGPMKDMAGKILTGIYNLDGNSFMALDGGPQFKFNASVSFFVNCETEEELDTIWATLVDGGTVQRPIKEYPFSKKFGCVYDRFGLLWQPNLAPRSQKITPFLLFSGAADGKAEEAMTFYTTLFPDSKITYVRQYGADAGENAGGLEYGVFQIAGQEFMAMDGAHHHDFTFNEAISFHVECETQAEVDHLWNHLSAVPESEQCGWLKDKYGVSWQIIPKALGELISDPDPEKSRRVTEAMLQMKKIDVAELEKAYHG
jgi:predicted 3-demethylubiquinone-9 3-methyltransferase (glyoxalase superfamily)